MMIVKSREDVERLKETLNQLGVVRAVVLEDKRRYCARYLYRKFGYVRFIACMLRRFKQYIHVYTPRGKHVSALIYPPWKVLLVDCSARVELGCLSLVFKPIDVLVFEDGVNEIWIYPRKEYHDRAYN